MNHTIDTTAPANDHYLGLAGARILPTIASRLTQRHLATVIKARALFCIHGDVGLGKTFALNTSLRDLAPDNTLWLECRKGAPLGTLRKALFRALAMPGDPPKGDELDELLREVFAEQHRVLVCDEAQGLTKNSLEYLQTLWENKSTQLTVILAAWRQLPPAHPQLRRPLLPHLDLPAVPAAHHRRSPGPYADLPRPVAERRPRRPDVDQRRRLPRQLPQLGQGHLPHPGHPRTAPRDRLVQP